MTTQTQVRSTEEALKMALEALKDNQNIVADSHRHAYVMEYNDIIEKCEEALAQQSNEQVEPVAWQERQAKRMSDGVVTEWTNWYPCRYRTIDEARAEACDHIPYEWRPLYTHPPVPTAQPELQTCNCRWDGEVQVQQCTLHESHVDAVHEWAERAKTAEAKLKAQPKEPEQRSVSEHLEPVAFLVYAKGSRRYFTLTFDVEKVPEIYKGGEAVPLYTTPPYVPTERQRTAAVGEDTRRAWVGLTDEDCFDALKAVDPEAKRLPLGFSMFAANVQAKLKEKNT